MYILGDFFSGDKLMSETIFITVKLTLQTKYICPKT